MHGMKWRVGTQPTQDWPCTGPSVSSPTTESGHRFMRSVQTSRPLAQRCLKLTVHMIGLQVETGRTIVDTPKKIRRQAMRPSLSSATHGSYGKFDSYLIYMEACGVVGRGS